MALDEALRDLSGEYERSLWEPRLWGFLEQGADDAERVVLLTRAARYYLARGDFGEFENALERARRLATADVSLLHIAVSRAFRACAYGRIAESDDLLANVQLDELRGVTHSSLRAWTLAIRGRNALHRGEFSAGIEYSQDSLSESSPDESAAGFANMTLLYSFMAILRYEEAIRYGNDYLLYTIRTGVKPWISTAHGLLSTLFVDTGDAELARFHRDLAIVDSDWDQFESAQSQSWLAVVQLYLGDIDAAIPLAQHSLRLALVKGNKEQIAAAHILLGRIHLTQHQLGEAHKHFEEAFTFESSIGDVPKMTLYRNMATCLRDMDRKEETADILWKLWTLQHDFDRRTHAALLSYQVRLEEKIHRQQRELLQLRTNQLERDLSQTASQLVARTELLTKFRDEINTILHQGTDATLTVKEIRQKLKTLPVEEMNWTTFDAQFTTVHPDFAVQLTLKYPDLSPAEVRLCKLLRLNLKSSEIARLFSLSERTIETQRFAVRKKLGLTRTDSVADALATI